MPDWRPEILRRLSRARLAPEREADIADEVAQHLEDRFRTLVMAGHSEKDAERAAWRELDEADVLGRRLAAIESAPTNLSHVEAARRGRLLGGLWQDVRYAARSLRKHPLLSATIVVTLALSLGPTTVVLGMANALFLKPLPAIAHQEHLLNFLFGTSKGSSVSPWFISYANAADITREATTMNGMAGTQPIDAGLSVDGLTPRREHGTSVTANYFDLLGVRPVAGRDFRAEDDQQPGGEAVLLLSEALARGLFGSSAAALGRTVRLNGVPFAVVGVMPRAFEGTIAGDRPTFWIPGMAYSRASNYAPERWSYGPNRGPFYAFVVRMAEGATVPQVTEELRARTRAIATRDPDAGKIFETVGPILQAGFAAPASLRPIATRAMQIIGVLAGVLVLLGMANVANLQIFRGLATSRDVAIRKALGASRARIAQLRLVESLMLAVAGAAAGVALSLGLGTLVSDLVLPGIGVLEIAVDWRVLAATTTLAVLVGIGFGLAPVLLAVRESVTGAIGRGTRTLLPRASRLRRVLAAVQIALSFTLLIGALLFLATLRNLHAVDLGFDPSALVTVGVNLRNYGYTEARTLDFERQLLEMISRQPQVDAVAVAYSPPLLGASMFDRVYLPDDDPKRARETAVNGVSADYFQTIGLPLLHGRMFTADEVFGTVPPDSRPIILSATLAEALFGSTDVVGRDLRMPVYQKPPVSVRIVGVTRESHFGGIDTPPDAVIYEPINAFPLKGAAQVIVRSSAGADSTSRMIADTAKTIDPVVALAQERTVSAIIEQRLAQQRLFAWILGVLGSIGFLLAAVGLHGLVAQTVTERTREFGIRVAIGAERSEIARIVLRQAALVAAGGLATGLTLAWFAARLVESRLYGVTIRDPALYLTAAGLVAIVVAIASAGPARLATRVDPIDVLRGD